MRFLVGGGSAVIVDAVLYVILKTRMNFSMAKVISYIAGAADGFVINKYWTFGSMNFKIYEIIKYVLLYGCSAAANASVNKFALRIVHSTIFAFVCATGTSTIINFVGQKFFVFRIEEGK